MSSTVISEVRDEDEFDVEWLHLVLLARSLGLTTDEVRTFLKLSKEGLAAKNL